jgi:hemin uptake protein HemP
VTTDTPLDPNLSSQPIPISLPEREINTRDLMQGQREIVIRHGDEAYRLSVTRSGKLILRK